MRTRQTSWIIKRHIDRVLNRTAAKSMVEGRSLTDQDKIVIRDIFEGRLGDDVVKLYEERDARLSRRT